MVSLWLVSYLNSHGLMPQLQSAYQRHHSTETRLLKVLSDVYAAIDHQQVTLLGLLDLSAAYNHVDHNILLHRLHHKFGICRTELEWISSDPLLGGNQFGCRPARSTTYALIAIQQKWMEILDDRGSVRALFVDQKGF